MLLPRIDKAMIANAQRCRLLIVMKVHSQDGFAENSENWNYRRLGNEYLSLTMTPFDLYMVSISLSRH